MEFVLKESQQHEIDYGEPCHTAGRIEGLRQSYNDISAELSSRVRELRRHLPKQPAQADNHAPNPVNKANGKEYATDAVVYAGHDASLPVHNTTQSSSGYKGKGKGRAIDSPQNVYTGDNCHLENYVLGPLYDTEEYSMQDPEFEYNLYDREFNKYIGPARLASQNQDNTAGGPAVLPESWLAATYTTEEPEFGTATFYMFHAQFKYLDLVDPHRFPPRDEAVDELEHLPPQPPPPHPFAPSFPLGLRPIPRAQLHALPSTSVRQLDAPTALQERSKDTSIEGPANTPNSCIGLPIGTLTRVVHTDKSGKFWYTDGDVSCHTPTAFHELLPRSWTSQTPHGPTLRICTNSKCPMCTKHRCEQCEKCRWLPPGSESQGEASGSGKKSDQSDDVNDSANHEADDEKQEQNAQSDEAYRSDEMNDSGNDADYEENQGQAVQSDEVEREMIQRDEVIEGFSKEEIERSPQQALNGEIEQQADWYRTREADPALPIPANARPRVFLPRIDDGDEDKENRPPQPAPSVDDLVL